MGYARVRTINGTSPDHYSTKDSGLRMVLVDPHFKSIRQCDFLYLQCLMGLRMYRKSKNLPHTEYQQVSQWGVICHILLK